MGRGAVVRLCARRDYVEGVAEPYLGYAAASEPARDAQASSRPVRELAQERGVLPPEVIDAPLADPRRFAGTAGPPDAAATRLSAEPPTTITGGTA